MSLIYEERSGWISAGAFSQVNVLRLDQCGPLTVSGSSRRAGEMLAYGSTVDARSGFGGGDPSVAPFGASCRADGDNGACLGQGAQMIQDPETPRYSESYVEDYSQRADARP